MRSTCFESLAQTLKPFDCIAICEKSPGNMLLRGLQKAMQM